MIHWINVLSDDCVDDDGDDDDDDIVGSAYDIQTVMFILSNTWFII